MVFGGLGPDFGFVECLGEIGEKLYFFLIVGSLRDAKGLTKVIFFIHDIGEAFMADVEKVNKGLYITLLQEVHTDHLLVVDFMVVIIKGNAVSKCMLGSIFFIIF